MLTALVIDVANNVFFVVEHINFIKTFFWKLNIKSFNRSRICPSEIEACRGIRIGFVVRNCWVYAVFLCNPILSHFLGY